MEELKLNIEELEKRIAPSLSIGGGIVVDVGLQIGGGGGASGGCDSGSGSGSDGSHDDEHDESGSS
jgi:hypothetical protein